MQNRVANQRVFLVDPAQQNAGRDRPEQSAGLKGALPSLRYQTEDSISAMR
jgi:hypothetical protein